jgi:large subunit ribosomal protein L30
MAIKLRVTQVRSGVSRPQPQVLCLKGLGLNKMHRTVELNDTPAIRGLIRKVSHLVKVEPVG